MKVTIIVEEVLRKNYVIDVEGVEDSNMAKEIASSRMNTLYENGDIELGLYNSDSHSCQITSSDCIDPTAETQITIKQNNIAKKRKPLDFSEEESEQKRIGRKI